MPVYHVIGKPPMEFRSKKKYNTLTENLKFYFKTRKEQKQGKLPQFPCSSYFRKALKETAAQYDLTAKDFIFCCLLFERIFKASNQWKEENKRLPSQKIHLIRGKDVGIEIYFKDIQFYCSKRYKVIDNKALVFSPYDPIHGKCRKLGFTCEFTRDFISNYRKQIARVSNKQLIDIYTNKEYNISVVTKHFSKLWEQAQKCYTPMPLKLEYILEVISKLENTRFTTREYQAVRSLDVILSKAEFKENIVYYTPKYTLCKTGRSFEQNGGFQTLPKEYKAILCKDFYNYDIKASHMTMLYILAKDLRLKPPIIRWLKNYITSKFDKTISSFQISKDNFKKILYSVTVGASINGHFKTTLGKYAQVNKDKLISFMKTPLKIFHTLKEKVRNKNNSMQLPLPDISSQKITSLIQGLEQFFINKLIVKCKKYKVLANEHDGFISIKKVPFPRMLFKTFGKYDITLLNKELACCP